MRKEEGKDEALYTELRARSSFLMFPVQCLGNALNFLLSQPQCLSFWIVVLSRYDLDSGIKVSLGNHDDSATCVEYSAETCNILRTLEIQ